MDTLNAFESGIGIGIGLMRVNNDSGTRIDSNG